jgi:C4-dicarboxylate-specific signal transduction histidine kinase
MATAMATEVQKSGIDVVGDMAAWGTHFCLFYETKEDLLSTLISYCKAGLESDECCLWIVADPLTIEEATAALRSAVPDLDRYLANSSLELAPARDWFLQGGTFDGQRVTNAWYEKLASVSARGYTGVRVTGDTTWLTKKDWGHFCAYEDGLNEVITNKRLAVLCTYPLTPCGALQMLDVVRTHQFVIARRCGIWEIVESAELKRAKAEINLLNEELEQRVIDRTSQLMVASEALREAQMELSHANRVTMMGQMAASIVHEVNQPISAAVNNAHAALNWLESQPPDLAEVRQSLDDIIRDNNRASDVINRIRALVKKAPPRKVGLKINDVILDVIALTRVEVAKNRVSLQTQLKEGLPLIQGDRVQLQQVILNLIINAAEAMGDATEGPRELMISTAEDPSNSVHVEMRDSGSGLKPEGLNRLFDPFYTTKPGGMGMGLSICRSIIEAHGGKIWATANVPRGAVFHCTLPVGESVDYLSSGSMAISSPN